MIKQPTLIKTLAVQNELGEGVIWDGHRQVVWWTDIPNSQLYRYSLANDHLESFATPERLACFTPIADDARLLCAFASGFAFFCPKTRQVEWIKQLEQDNPGTRFNDGKTDRAGRFWAGTMVENSDQATDKGRLYCVDHDLTISEHLTNLSITNSLCWSPDGKTAYHTDTPTRCINSYVSGTTPQLSKPRLLVKTQRGAYPDGSCVDADGYIWNAQWAASQVVRYSAIGETDLVLKLPTSQPTCVAFAGDKLDTLIVTTAWQDMDESQRRKEPDAGNVFIYTTPYRGLADSPFVLKSR